jgi:hypothetical protein
VSTQLAPSWAEHAEAAAAMGLDPQTAYETYDGGFLGLARACRERTKAMLDAAGPAGPLSTPGAG